MHPLRPAVRSFRLSASRHRAFASSSSSAHADLHTQPKITDVLDAPKGRPVTVLSDRRPAFANGGSKRRIDGRALRPKADLSAASSIDQVFDHLSGNLSPASTIPLSLPFAASALHRLMQLSASAQRVDDRDKESMAELLLAIHRSLENSCERVGSAFSVSRGAVIRCVYGIVRLYGSPLMPHNDRHPPFDRSATAVLQASSSLDGWRRPITAILLEATALLRKMDESRPQDSRWDTRDAANLVWALAKVAEWHKDTKADEGKAALVDACGWATEKVSATLRDVERERHGRGGVKPLDVSTMVWGLGKFRYCLSPKQDDDDPDYKYRAVSAPTSIASLCRSLDALLPSIVFNHMQLTDTAWGLARLSVCRRTGEVGERLYHRMAEAAMPLIDGFSTRSLTSFLWSFGHSQYLGHPSLLLAIQSSLLTRIASLTPQCFSNTMWAYGRLIEDVNPADPPEWAEPAHLVNWLASFASSDVYPLEGAIPQNMSNTIWGLAVLASHLSPGQLASLKHGPVGHLCQRVARDGTKMLSTFHHQPLQNLVWGFSVLGYGYARGGHQDSVSVLYERAADEAERRLAYHLGRMRERERERVGDTSEPNRRDTVSMVMAFARAGYYPPGYCKTLSAFLLADNPTKETKCRVAAYNTKSVVTLLTGWSKYGPQAVERPLFNEIADILHARLPTMSMTDMVRSLSAYAPLPSPPTPLFDAVARLLHEKGPDYLVQTTPFDAATLAWAYARAGCVNKEAFFFVSQFFWRKPKNLAKCTPVQLALTCWGFGRSGVCDEELLGMITTHVMEERDWDTFAPRDLATIAWAYGTLGLRHPSFFTQLTEWSLSHLPSFTPLALTTLLWAAASTGHTDPQFYDKIASEIDHRLGERDIDVLAMDSSDPLGDPACFTLRNLADVVWSLVTAGCLDAPVFDRIRSIVADKKVLVHTDRKTASKVAWAYGKTAGGLPTEMWEALTDRALREGNISRDEVVRLMGGETKRYAPTSSILLADHMMAHHLARCPPVVEMRAHQSDGPGKDVPRVLYESPLWWVLYKPPKWTVLPSLPPPAAGEKGSRADEPREDSRRPDLWTEEPAVAIDKAKRMVASDEQEKLHLLLARAWCWAKNGSPILCNGDVDYGIAHRLDADTSGALIVAKIPAAWHFLRMLFDAQMVSKEYLCLVHGRVPAGQHWAADKLKTESGELYSTTSVEEDGRVAVTYYECLGHLQRTPTEAESDSAGACSEGSASMMSLVRVRLITGRTHQIRVHLSNTGYPLVGENRYATARQIEDDKTWVPRLFLHCHNLRFCDLQGQPVDVSCPLPSDLQDVLRQLQPVHLIES